MIHPCAESDICTCYMLADAPNEECPIHGHGTWPPRCGTCGRLLPWSVRRAPESIDDLRWPTKRMTVEEIRAIERAPEKKEEE